MELQKRINERYKELASQLGDAHFRLSKLKLQIEQIEQEMEGLNTSLPHLIQLELKEKAKEKGSNG